jgi:hypothetical protein
MSRVDTASPVHDYDRRVRQARRGGYAVGIGAFVVGFFFYAVLKSATGQSNLVDLLILLAQSLWVGAPTIGYVAYSRMAKRDGLLLWLRRFRGAYGRKIRFHQPLGVACSGMLYPVTIQDNSFKASAMFSLLRLWVLIPGMLFLWIIGLLLVLVVAYPVIVKSSSAAGVVLILLWTGFFSWGLWTLMTRAGFLSMPRELSQAQQEARRRFKAARDGKRAPGVGVEVLKCEDEVRKDGKKWEIWQAVVFEALSVAAVVIVEVTEVTNPLFWELTQALTHVDKDRILLVAEEGATTPDRLASQLCGPLTLSTGQAVTPEWVQAALFTYPATQAHPHRRRQQYKVLAERLRRELALRVAR